MLGLYDKEAVIWLDVGLYEDTILLLGLESSHDDDGALLIALSNVVEIDQV